MKTFRFLTLLTIGLALSAPASFAGMAVAAATQRFPVTVLDDHGNRVQIPRAPRRIITLFPGQTEILFALGLESRVVADGSKYAEGAQGIARAFRYPQEWPSRWGRDYPVRSKSLPHVEGGCCGVHFNLETVESLHPDLVFAPYTQTELPTYQKMRDLGIRVIILDPASFQGILRDFTLVGKATGNTNQAATVVARMKEQLASVTRRVAHARSRPRVYYEIDATNPAQPYTAGPGTFIDEAIRIAHGKNVADTVTSCSGTLCYPQFSLEELVKLNPQVIILGDASYGTTADAVKARGGWSSIAAVQTGKIYAFNDELITRAGPRVMVGLRAMARLIHPESFRN